MAVQVTDLLVCPACFGHLTWSDIVLTCDDCGRRFPIDDGIPVLVAGHGAIEERDADSASDDDDYKAQQARFFDEEDPEFEITRPHGTPRVYGWLLGEKVRRGLRGVSDLGPGTTVLTVCGGSGMDAELLAKTGARVVTSDISIGAAKRARERARRYGVELLSIVADVEHLPFRDRSIDLVFVHDGLHHLESPLLGLAEMTRVAARAVSVTEPAQAAATALAVRVGLAQVEEEAGNRIGRMTPEVILTQLEQRGFRIAHAERYAMYYRHKPGVFSRVVSLPVIFPLYRLAWRLGNRLIGRFGNKLTVQGLRTGSGHGP